MYKYISFNHKICLVSKAQLPALSSTALYGKGIFTTVAVYRGKPFQWEKHWLRLTENARKIGVDLSEFSEKTVKNSFAETIAKNNLTESRARLTFFVESSGGIWQTERRRKTSFLIQTADFRVASGRLCLTVSPFQINSQSALANTKSCNYLDNLLALEDAKNRGFDEAIRANEKGEIASACAANIFWVKNGRVFTPSVETGCLAGTTRSFVSENFAVSQKKAKLNEILKADEIFITSAGIGVASVKKFEGKFFGNDVTKRVRRIFGEATLNFR